ncbi:MAG TPA: hypothetical protein VGP07_02720 [Polyangia bacterium]|jgi:hypothetical protein
MKRQRSWTFRAARWTCLAALIAVAVTSMSAAVAGPTADALPDDVRLASVRTQLREAIARADRAGLPTRPLITKVREGLAKGAAPGQIVTAVEGLAHGLDDANRLVRAHGRPVPSPALLEALAVARSGGASDEAVLPLVVSKMDEARLLQAIDVVGDLALRGYPGRQGGLVVRDVAERDASALGHLVAGLESIRRGQTVSRAVALDALGANLATSGSLDAAVSRSLEGGEHGAAASNGKNGEGSEHAAAASKKGMAKGLK